MASILALSALAAVGALDIEAASGRFGVIVIANEYDKTPVVPVTNTLGGSIVVSFSKGFFLSLQPSLDLYWTNYKWYEGRAVPTETETGEGNNAFVLGFIVDLPVTATFAFSSRVGGAASLGPAFLLRAAFAYDQTPSEQDTMAANLSSIVGYFWQAGRWFNPSAALRFDVYLQENFTFAFGARALFPIHNLWNGGAALIDEGLLHITMAMIVGL